MRHNPAAGAVVIMAPPPSKCPAELRRADRARLPSLRDRAADLVAASESRDGRPRGEINGLSAQSRPLSNYRDLTGFDFASSEVNEALTHQLHRCEFLEDAHNVVLVGGPGTGKTPLRSASRRSSTTASASASSPPLNWSRLLNKRTFRANLARSPPGSP